MDFPECEVFPGRLRDICSHPRRWTFPPAPPEGKAERDKRNVVVITSPKCPSGIAIIDAGFHASRLSGPNSPATEAKTFVLLDECPKTGHTADMRFQQTIIMFQISLLMWGAAYYGTRDLYHAAQAAELIPNLHIKHNVSRLLEPAMLAFG